MAEPDPIIVVGGGWAGLSCAVELARLGHRVTVLEAARQPGGRARRVSFDQLAVDNGQHLLLGAYHQTLHVLQTVGIAESTALLRLPLALHLHDPQLSWFSLTAPALPAPLHLLAGLLTAHGLTTRERSRAMRFGARLWLQRIQHDRDITVIELLLREQQSENLIRCLWEPLCLAALNTPVGTASAEIFLTVLRDAFCHQRRDSDVLLPRSDLGRLLPDPAVAFITRHGGSVVLSQRVDELLTDRRRIVGVRCNNQTIAAKQVVLAVPPHATLPLLKTIPAMQDTTTLLQCLHYQPICTVYVQYPADISADFPLEGFIGRTAQWLVDRKLTGNPGLMAVVISGPGQHLALTHEALATRILQELSDIHPHWPAAEHVQVICEKRATFSSNVGVNACRPDNRTSVDGLWLAGDHTNTGYPATIEGAVRSGLRCAHLIRGAFLETHHHT